MCSDLDFTGRVLSECNPDDLHYELFAISEHYGGLGGGHCTILELFLLILTLCRYSTFEEQHGRNMVFI